MPSAMPLPRPTCPGWRNSDSMSNFTSSVDRALWHVHDEAVQLGGVAVPLDLLAARVEVEPDHVVKWATRPVLAGG